MVNRTQSIDESTILSLINELAVLSQAAKNVREKLLKIVPAKYGSDLWWEKSDKEANEQVKRGNYTTVKNEEELKKFLGL